MRKCQIKCELIDNDRNKNQLVVEIEPRVLNDKRYDELNQHSAV